MYLNKQEFALELKRLLSVLGDKPADQAKNIELFEEYYNHLKKYTREDLSNGISALIENEDFSFMPSVNKIIQYTEKEMFNGYSKRDIENLIKTEELTKSKFDNPAIQKLISKYKQLESSNLIQNMSDNNMLIKENQNISKGEN